MVRPEIPLNVLVVGTDDWAVDQAVAALAARGHRPLTCHRSGDPVFPCNALIDGGVCPLDVGFSVVVTVRARISRIPAQAELGVICGLHAGAELVVAGVSADNPFERWCQRTVQLGGDLVTECERAAEVVRNGAAAVRDVDGTDATAVPLSAAATATVTAAAAAASVTFLPAPARTNGNGNGNGNGGGER